MGILLEFVSVFVPSFVYSMPSSNITKYLIHPYACEIKYWHCEKYTIICEKLSKINLPVNNWYYKNLIFLKKVWIIDFHTF
jgi:hypothetical protein